MIRIATETDLPAIRAIYAPFVTDTTNTFEYDVPTAEAFLDRFRNIIEKFPWLVWEEDGVILGYAYGAAPFERAAYRWCAEPSLYLAPEAQGRGIGRRLYEALEAILQRQGYCLLYAIITESNRNSLAFHKALGYSPVAAMPGCGFKHGAWQGITWMEKRLSTPQNPGAFPIPWHKLP